jgi:hypothetical protein
MRNIYKSPESLQVEDAKKEFLGVLGRPFNFFHCWEILRDQEKWKNQLKGLPEEPQLDSAEAGAGKDSTSAAGTPESVRPMGRDSAKKQRSSSVGASTESNAYLEVLQSLNDRKEQRLKASEEFRQDFKRKLELKEISVQQVERDMDYKIMMTNTDNLNPTQRRFILMQQEAILRKWGIND